MKIHGGGLVATLTGLYVLSFLDRQFLSTAIKQVRGEIAMTDVQYGLLTGFAFAACYTLFSLPLSRVADSNRGRSLIIGSVLIWSLATAACGLARNYEELLVARMVVGCGEAALVPAAYAMLARRYVGSDFAKASGVFSIGPMLGSGLALFLGGPLIAVIASWSAAPLSGWRLSFIAFGAFGLIAAAIATRLPTNFEGAKASPAHRVSIEELKQFFTAGWHWFGLLTAGCVLITAFATGLAAWQVELVQKVYHWDIARTGVALGAGVLTLGILSGPVWGAVNAHVLRRWGEAASPLILMISALGSLICTWIATLQASGVLAISALILMPAFIGALGAVAPQIVVTQAPTALRAQVLALYLTLVTLLGLSVGPLLFAFAAQNLFAGHLANAIAAAATVLLTGAAVCCLGAARALTSQSRTAGVLTKLDAA